jgi:hypothetical protein
LAKELSERKRGEFPAQTIPNPRGHEQLKAMTTLRSGKTIDNKVRIELDERVLASPTVATRKGEGECTTFPSKVSKANERKATYGHF